MDINVDVRTDIHIIIMITHIKNLFVSDPVKFRISTPTPVDIHVGVYSDIQWHIQLKLIYTYVIFICMGN